MIENEYYVLRRSIDSRLNYEYMIVSVLPGGDPLYGNGSWDLYKGPFETWEQANEYLDDYPEVLTKYETFLRY